MNLYTMLDEQYLLECWTYLNKKAAGGIDKVSAVEYEQNLKSNIKYLVERLKRKSYRAGLIKRKDIPKGNGKTRPLGIPIVEDKLLQIAVSRILTAIYEEDFIAGSYGYRVGKGVKDAVFMISNELRYKYYSYVVEADIKGFFTNIDHDWLIRMLSERVNDNAILNLIRKWLKAGVLLESGVITHPVHGTPQGGVISPILSNIYLHYVMDIWVERVVGKHCYGKIKYFRYADDFICFFQKKTDAEKFYRILPKRLGKFNLSLAEEKTKILLFYRGKITESKRFSFLGFEFFWGYSRTGKASLKKRTCPKKLNSSINAFKEWCKRHRSVKLRILMSMINAKFRGYFNHYGVIGNTRSMWLFYHHTVRILFKWLNRRSQRKSFNWQEFRRMVDRYKLQKPFISQKRDNQRRFNF